MRPSEPLSSTQLANIHCMEILIEDRRRKKDAAGASDTLRAVRGGASCRRINYLRGQGSFPPSC
jgi:hypothetical protein